MAQDYVYHEPYCVICGYVYYGAVSDVLPLDRMSHRMHTKIPAIEHKQLASLAEVTDRTLTETLRTFLDDWDPTLPMDTAMPGGPATTVSIACSAGEYERWSGVAHRYALSLPGLLRAAIRQGLSKHQVIQ